MLAWMQVAAGLKCRGAALRGRQIAASTTSPNTRMAKVRPQHTSLQPLCGHQTCKPLHAHALSRAASTTSLTKRMRRVCPWPVSCNLNHEALNSCMQACCFAPSLHICSQLQALPGKLPDMQVQKRRGQPHACSHAPVLHWHSSLTPTRMMHSLSPHACTASTSLKLNPGAGPSKRVSLESQEGTQRAEQPRCSEEETELARLRALRRSRAFDAAFSSAQTTRPAPDSDMLEVRLA